MEWFSIALLSSFLSAFAAIAQKKVLFTKGAFEFSLLLSIANLLFSIPFFFMIDFGTLNSFNLSILFIKSIIGVGSFLCVMTALKNLQISSALPLLALTPGFVAIFAFLFLGESLKLAEILGLVSFMAGVYILESKNLKDIFSAFNVFTKSKHHRYILGALILFTVSSVMDKFLLSKMKLTPISLTAFQHLFFAIIFGLIYSYLRAGKKEYSIELPKKEIGWIVLISFLTIGYRLVQAIATSGGSVALTLAIKRTSVFWATVIGGTIFKDTGLIKKIIAVIFILLGAILILRFN